MTLYEEYCRPKLARMLSALKLDVHYESARGARISTADGREVIDFIGGFGTLLLGHNNHELKQTLIEALERDQIVHAQAAPNEVCGTLARQLNELVPADASYTVHFSNSGAESVEAALKHAYKRYSAALEARFIDASRALDAAGRALARTPNGSSEAQQTLERMRTENALTLQRLLSSPAIVALHGSFHGKLTSSLKVTSNPGFREDFAAMSSLRTLFIRDREVERLPELLADEQAQFHSPHLTGDVLQDHPIAVRSVMALILEVVQGEGGARLLSDEALEYVANERAAIGLPLIVDEVQTGCGRTGAVFGYALTPLVGIDPDYITLSKALGGGLVKIAATMIRSDVYDDDFGIQHTSTFGEDALAARVAIKVLEILSRDDGALVRSVATKGRQLRAALDGLAREYPSIVAEVRGRGLMLGLELRTLTDTSPFFRATSETGALALFVASYLLHYHGLRMFCPLNSLLSHGRLQNCSTIRIQPTIDVEIEDIERLVRGLREVFEIIAANNEYALLNHLFAGDVPECERTAPQRFPASLPRHDTRQRPDAICGFVAHPTSLPMLLRCLLPSFAERAPAPDAFCAWWEAACEFIDPTHVRSEYVQTKDALVRSDMILIPYLPTHIERLKQSGELAAIRSRIEDAIGLAEQLAARDGMQLSSMGLGAYTSIVSNNGEQLRPRTYPVTTGNAYTTALIVESIERLVAERGLDWSTLELSIVGATGNIGSVLAQIFAHKCGRLRLVGRSSDDSLRRLRLVQRECLRSLLRSLTSDRDALVGGDLIRRLAQFRTELAGEAADSEPRRALAEATQARSISGEMLDALYAQLERRSLLRIELGRSVGELRTSDIVIIATDSANGALITPRLLKPGTIVCCASVPTNLSPDFIGNRDFLAFDGGLARLPAHSTVDYPGFPAGGLSYGCHSESIIAGLEHDSDFRSIGVLTASDVSLSMELARRHGFQLGDLRLHNQLTAEI